MALHIMERDDGEQYVIEDLPDLVSKGLRLEPHDTKEGLMNCASHCMAMAQTYMEASHHIEGSIKHPEMVALLTMTEMLFTALVQSGYTPQEVAEEMVRRTQWRAGKVWSTEVGRA